MLHQVKSFNRHSPVAHKVKAHEREGNHVHSYIRGSGKPRPKLPFKPTGSIQGRPIDHKNAYTVFPEVKAWTINFKYREGDIFNSEQGESVMVFSRSYHNALDEGYEERKYKHRTPIAVDIVDPDLGSMISFIREKANSPMAMKIGKATSLGAKYAVEAKTKVADSTAGRKIRGKIFSNAGKALNKRGGFFGGLLGEHIEGKSKAISEALEDKNAQKYLKEAWDDDPKKRAVARAFLKRNHPEIYNAADFSRSSNVITSKVIHIHKDAPSRDVASEKKRQDEDEANTLLMLQKRKLDALNKSAPEYRHNHNPELENLKAEKAKMIANRTPEEHAKYIADVASRAKEIMRDNEGPKDKPNKPDKSSRDDKRDENR